MTKKSTFDDKNNDNRIQVYVLSRDRVDYLDETLQSILNQDGICFDLVVSDNSEHDDVQKMIQIKYPGIKYVRRVPVLSAMEHFRLVISECNREFSVLFHDDDVMMPGYLIRMVGAFDQYPNISAVGCNAFILKGDTLTGNCFMRSFSRPVILETPESLLEPYLGFGIIGPAPFPGYMYRTSAISNLCLDASEGGKYSDVSFLMKVQLHGPLYWLPDPLIQYRIHPGNDSSVDEIGQRMSLLRYIYRNTSLTSKSKIIDEYRFDFWLKWLISHFKSISDLRSRRIRTIVKFLLIKSVELALTKYSFWIRIKNRMAQSAVVKNA